MGNKFFFKPIGSNDDIRLRFEFNLRQGKVKQFLVQLELHVRGKWKPVVRYDNAHDFPHRDVLDTKGRLVEKTLLKLGTLDEIIEYAEQDLADRVDWYIERFLKTRDL
ncbi:MAG: hypothetical protein ABIG11_00635 [bacterium]